MLWPLVLLGMAAGVPVAGTACGPVPAAQPDSLLPVDHHAHLMSPELVRDWKSLGVPFSRPDSVYTSVAALMTRVGFVVLVPMGHLYANREFREALGLAPGEERARVQHENDYVAAEAARHAGRAVALCSVNPRRSYARDELERCRSVLHTAGVKVHVASAEIDLRRDDHLAALAAVAGWAAGQDLPLLVHLDPQMRGHGVDDIARFAATVLEPYPDLVAVIAHLGGSGGYGEWTQSVFRVLREWLDTRRDRHLYFDLSAVVLERESEGVPPTTPAEAAALARDVRAVGLDRLLFASDYPVFDPTAYAEVLRARLGLTPAESARLLANRAPGL